MVEGTSLHVGVNRVDPSHYDGFDPVVDGDSGRRLLACEQDAMDYQAITADEGFISSLLCGKAATAVRVVDAITAAAARLASGDMFVLTYSGYGGLVPDVHHGEQGESEATWALFDRQLAEDERMALLALFRPGVRLLVIDDSSSPLPLRRSSDDERRTSDDMDSYGQLRIKALPSDVMVATYRSHRDLYDQIQESCPPGAEIEIPAAVLILNACAQDQAAGEGLRNGVFTESFLRVWDGGGFQGDYEEFVEAVATSMPKRQMPVLTERGRVGEFIRERPLRI
jgi:hypothetical protein